MPSLEPCPATRRGEFLLGGTDAQRQARPHEPRPAPALKPARARPAAASLAAALLAACASPPATQFHTLVAAPTDTPAAPASGISFRIDSPVRVPAQVDRPQLVVRRADGSVQVMEQQRWVAPLSEEWRDALAGRLAQDLGALDVSRIAAPGSAPYRLRLELQRFDSEPGRVAQQALWSVLRPGDAQAALTCRASAQAPAGTDAAALAAAHRQVLAQLAGGIAAAVRALHDGRAATCP